MKTTEAARLAAVVLTQHDERIRQLETRIPANFAEQVEQARATLAAQVESKTKEALANLQGSVSEQRIQLERARDAQLLELRALAEGEVIRRFQELPPAPAGPKGDGFRWRGNWQRGTRYEANDVVYSRGSSWVCVRASIDEPPMDSSAEWGRMASAGANGQDATGGAGVSLSDATPAALGTAAAGVATTASRTDHVHPMPDAQDINVPAFSATVEEVLEIIDDVADTALAQASATVASSNFIATNDQIYHVVATCTVTDPTPPVEGKGFTVLLINGTVTLTSGAISGDGKFIRRVWHSGSWRTHVYSPD